MCSTTQFVPSKDLGARANQEISTSAADTISTGYGLGGGGGRKDLNVLLGQVNCTSHSQSLRLRKNVRLNGAKLTHSYKN